MFMERNLKGKIKTLTRFCALFSCDGIETKSLPKTNQNIGIDVNLEKKSWLTLSNGVKNKHSKIYKKSEKKLIRARKSLSNKVRGSQNWLDAKLSLAKKWEK